jgi:methionine-rich copper-binding protein CopC
VVARSPEKVRIWFDSALEPVFSTIMVHAAKDDAMVSRNDGRVNEKDPTLLEVSVAPLGAGEYVVYWSVVARDGHQTFGKYKFTVKPVL